MKKLLYLVLTIAILVTVSCHERTTAQTAETAAPTTTPEIIADFDHTLSQALVMKRTGSFSAAIVKNDSIIWSKAFGNADDQKNIVADTSTIYRIGSISKTFTAYLMMLLVQKGVIRLDDPVVTYLPEIASLRAKGDAQAGAITFRELADHTAGLEREPGLSNAAMGPIEGWEQKVLSSIPTTKVNAPIGKNFAYSNIGYAMLGLALSRAAHKPFMDLVSEMIFQPLGMKNSFYIIPKGMENRIAAGYSWNGFASAYQSTQAQKELAGRGYKVPNGGIFTTANDLAHFAIALMAGTGPLEKKWCDTMQTIQTSESKEHGYGFGLMVNINDKNSRTVGHSGLVAGFASTLLFNPQTRTGVILFRDLDDASAYLDSQCNTLLSRLTQAAR